MELKEPHIKEPWEEYRIDNEGNVLPLEQSEEDLQKRKQEQLEFDQEAEEEKWEENDRKEFIKNLNEDKEELRRTYARR